MGKLSYTIKYSVLANANKCKMSAISTGDQNGYHRAFLNNMIFSTTTVDEALIGTRVFCDDRFIGFSSVPLLQ